MKSLVTFESPLGPFRLGNSWFSISLFIFKFKPTDGAGSVDSLAELVIDHVVPIVGKFSISVALSKRNTIDLRNPSSDPLTMNQPRTGILSSSVFFLPPLNTTIRFFSSLIVNCLMASNT